ncbi:hypothetical protein EU245_12185 [Lentibacillus lipolyticus]|nr:hypothetical protein EU245_12185 [Lentibacillus lipolyticus]
MRLNGEIIAGEMDEHTNEFMLQQVKHFSTESILSEKQVDTLTQYLIKSGQDGDGEQILTLYDQLPVRLNQEEIEQFIDDLDKIKSLYH